MRKIFILAFAAFFVSGTGLAAAAYPVDVWLPYWKKTEGIAEATPNLAPIWRVHPFSYEVQSDGTIVDLWNMDEIATDDFFLDVRAAKAKVVPTIAWHNGTEIMNILSSSTARKAHIDGIVAHAEVYRFDGVDIDYEGKPAESREHFSAFLQELSARLRAQKKILSCTIEARTPLSSRFTVIPADLEYANDYVAINRYCDEVNIMAYDQRDVDIILNAQKGKGGLPYLPVADREWVEKVIQETVKTIDKKKIRLGVPTFGYEYEMVLGKSDTGLVAGGYSRLRSITYRDFDGLVKASGMKPFRNAAGELSLFYISGNSIRIAWISDSEAVKAKVALAKKYGLKGVVVWTANGENDPNLWKVLK